MLALSAACQSPGYRAPVEDRTKPTAASAPAPAPTPAASSNNQAAVTASPSNEGAGKPGFVTVKAGDTLIRIAQEAGQNWRDIARWNNLSNPGVIEVGQVLRVQPPGDTSVAAAPAPAAAPTVAEGPVASRPVTQGRVESRTLEPRAADSGRAADGKVPDPKPVDTKPVDTKAPDTRTSETKPVETRATDGKAADARSDVKPADTKPADTRAADPRPNDTKSATDVKGADAKPGAPGDARPGDAGVTVNGDAVGDEVTGWIWPASGSVASTFDGQRHKGVAIVGKPGDPIVAAADGRVIYAGSSLRGYGNIVIIKHNNTYITAYAHNRTLLVKDEQVVRKGQRIAEMGSTDAERVQLHFELRKNGVAIDPLKHLPTR